MHTLLETLLLVGLLGMLLFAIMPFLLKTKLIDWIAEAKNPVCIFFGLYGYRRANRHKQLLTMLSRRLHLLSTLSALLLLVSCMEPSVPKPSTRAAVTSNEVVRTNIKQTRDSIKDSQIHAAKGASSLERADAGLNQLLATPPTTIPTPRPAPQPTVILKAIPVPSAAPTPAAKRVKRPGSAIP